MADNETSPQPNTPAHPKQPNARGKAFVSAVERALLSFKGRKTKTKDGSSLAGAKAPGGEAALYLHFEEYAWAKSAVAWLMAATGVVLLLTVVLIIGAVVVATRPQGLVIAEPSLPDVVKDEMGKGYVSNRDALEFYISSVLGIINNIDKFGSQMEMLRGLISPDVYDRISRRVFKNLPAIRRSLITQNLTVERLGNIVQSEEGNRVSIYVRGTLNIVQEIGEKGPSLRKVPYRAKIICEAVIPTAANHQHFYLVDLEECVGAKTTEWDAEHERNTK